MASCEGTPDNHCCWVEVDVPLAEAMASPARFAVGRDEAGVLKVAEVCEFFDPSALRGKNCSLRSELGSWPRVYADDRYVELWSGLGEHPIECGDFPIDEVCQMCGVSG